MRRLAFLVSLLVGLGLCQDTHLLFEKAVKEAQQFAHSAGNSDPRTDTLLKGQIEGLMKGLQGAAAKGSVDTETYSWLFSGAHGSGAYMNMPGASGKQEWQALCPDVIKILYTSPQSGRGGPHNIYCPSVDPASLPAAPTIQKAPPPPELTVRSYASDQTAVDFSGYIAPGILSPLYAAHYEHVADDRNTRDYIGSMMRKFNERCPQSAIAGASQGYAGLHYVFFYEVAANDQTLAKAMSNDLNGGFEAIIRRHLLQTTPHFREDALTDTDRFLSHFSCESKVGMRMMQNVSALVQDRYSQTPDVPNNQLFKAQFTALEKPSLVFSDQQSATMVGIKRRCEALMSRLTDREENYCRCQTQMLVSAGIPPDQLQPLTASFDKDRLEALAQRYTRYGQLRHSCDALPVKTISGTSASAYKLSDSLIDRVSLRVLGSTYGNGFNDQRRTLISNQIAALNGKGQRVISCSYRGPQGGGNGIDYWYKTVPANLAEVDHEADSPFRLLGNTAVQECPADYSIPYAERGRRESR